MARVQLEHIEYEMDVPSPAADGEQRFFVQIDPEKCTGCAECQKHCPTGAIYGEAGLTHKIVYPDPCLHCGLCLIHCPSGAIYETSSWLPQVEEKLQDSATICIAMPAPSIRYTVGESFGLPCGTNIKNKLISSFDRLGFRHCWDTEFAADVTIWEEGSEFIVRLADGGPFPQFSSCCSAWLRYAETFYPELLEYFSNCKSPMAINGRLAKTYGADRFNYRQHDLYTVAIMPCIAKKYEALLPELSFAGMRDIDAVLTVREFTWLLRKNSINPLELPDGSPDTLMGKSSGGTLFGVGGGVLETLSRFVCHKLTGQIPGNLTLAPHGDLEGITECQFRLGGQVLRMAKVHGARHFARICDDTLKGRCPYHFIEFMACPGGCINGGGQPILPDVLKLGMNVTLMS